MAGATDVFAVILLIMLAPGLLAGNVMQVKKDVPSPILMTSDVMVEFLMQMEEYSRAYAQESTTVKKDEMKKAIIEKGKSLLHGQQVTISVIINDVGAPEKGITHVKTGDIDFARYTRVEEKSLSISLFNFYGIEMDRTQALSVTPGNELELTGRLWFETDNLYVYGDPFPRAQKLFRFGLNHDLNPVGAVVMK